MQIPAPRLPLDFLLVTLAWAAVSACAVTSKGVRPDTLEKDTWRVGLSLGGSRDYSADFVVADPETVGPGSDFDQHKGILVELSGHYGLSDRIDVGLRLRPVVLGAKLEAMVQITEEHQSFVAIAVGAGIDSFYHSKETASRCGFSAGGHPNDCFNREIYGLAFDLPLILSKRLTAGSLVFVMVRYSHLLLTGRERLESTDGAYAPRIVEKRQRPARRSGARHVAGQESHARPQSASPRAAS